MPRRRPPLRFDHQLAPRIAPEPPWPEFAPSHGRRFSPRCARSFSRHANTTCIGGDAKNPWPDNCLHRYPATISESGLAAIAGIWRIAVPIVARTIVTAGAAIRDIPVPVPSRVDVTAKPIIRAAAVTMEAVPAATAVPHKAPVETPASV